MKMRDYPAVVLLLAVSLSAFSLPGPAVGDEFWTVRSGSAVLSFDAGVSEGGVLEIAAQDGAGSAPAGAAKTFRIHVDSTLTFAVEAGSLTDFLGGEVVLLGDLRIADGRARTALRDLRISQVRGAGAASWAIGGPGGFELERVKAGFNTATRTLTLHCPSVCLSAPLAEVIGDPGMAGQSIGSLTVEAEAEWIGGDAPSAKPVHVMREGGGPRSPGCDMSFCQLYGLYMPAEAREGDVVGLAVATTSWNLGDADCIWFPMPNEEHPFIVMDMFRLETVDGSERFEQIGQSWIKHGFYALAYVQCGGTCTHELGHGQGNWLGQGCTDTYSAPLNAGQNGMGPRYEVDPWTGGWTQAGSHNSQGNHSHDGIEHRLQVHDSDLDPAQNPGASYYGSAFYAMLDDVDAVNSASWKPVTVSGSPGGLWTFVMSNSGVMPEIGYPVDAWTSATQTLIAEEIPIVEFVSPDGRCVLSAQATDLGGGTWHYEYALLNLDMDRKVGSFSVPFFEETVVTNVGFHAVKHHDEGVADYSNDPWSVEVTTEAITWSTLDNPIRWSTLYNFRFDANQAPDAGDVPVTLGLFDPGTPTSVTGDTIGPYQGPPDCNTNGIPDECDLDCGAPGCTPPCGGSLDCDGNGIPDECDPDCNTNGVPDACDVDPLDPDGNGEVSEDCQPNGTPDECEVPPIGPPANDCQPNGTPDACDISSGSSADCDGDGLPDECEIAGNDCNQNGTLDACDISSGASNDCQPDGTPDECEIDQNSPAPGGPFFCEVDCDPDCNNNGTPDLCDLESGDSSDCNNNGVLDECEGYPPCNNDRCTNATDICPGTYIGSTVSADSDGAAGCGSSLWSPDVWYRYTPAGTGVMTVQTCGSSNYDTVLSAHLGCPGVPGNQHTGASGCDDNGCGDGMRSRLSLSVIGGETYLIRVSGVSGAEGDFELTLTGPECEPPGNPIRGGQMWDTWWVIVGASEPVGDHPLYPPGGQQSGSTTSRCTECHGWDYKGAGGAYGSGSHYTGIPGVFGSVLTRAEMFNLLKLDAPPNGHGYNGYGMWDHDVWDAVEFVQQMAIDTDLYIDGVGQFIGDEVQGEIHYTSGGSISCSLCHGGDGRAIDLGAPGDPVWLGHIAADDPWRFLHKVRFGHPGTTMPSWLGDGGTDQGAADIGLHCQASFCTSYPVGDMDADGDVDGGDIPAFIDGVLGSPSQDEICRGDFNTNDFLDVGDIEGFAAALLVH